MKRQFTDVSKWQKIDSTKNVNFVIYVLGCCDATVKIYSIYITVLYAIIRSGVLQIVIFKFYIAYVQTNQVPRVHTHTHITKVLHITNIHAAVQQINPRQMA